MYYIYNPDSCTYKQKHSDSFQSQLKGKVDLNFGTYIYKNKSQIEVALKTLHLHKQLGNQQYDIDKKTTVSRNLFSMPSLAHSSTYLQLSMCMVLKLSAIIIKLFQI